jgi:hypothetical protein
MNDQKTLLTIVLDETGSMMKRKDATISGFNEFLDSQKDKSLGVCHVTLIKFNSEKPSGAEVVYKDQDIDDAPALTPQTYLPNANTPLYDAVAFGIKHTEDKYKVANVVLAKLAGKDKTTAATPLVVFLVITDGEENSSQQYGAHDVRGMIETKKKEGWTFAFLGANQDSWAAAQPLGFDRGNIARYADHSAKQVAATYANVAHSMSAYRSTMASAGAKYFTAMNSGDQVSADSLEKEILALRQNFWGNQTDLSKELPEAKI